jgi:hypothetical protein
MTNEERLALEVLAVKAKRERGQCVDVIDGWKFALEREMMSLPGMHLSASLFPIGRGSTEADWHFLGEALAVLGAPEDSLLTPLETTPPNAVHHWHWDAPLAVIQAMRQFLASNEYKLAVAALRRAGDRG